ncbi:MAG: hypothetical protein IPH33_14055 [Bacteroidetes bacterium]|nr:hypothetical protein [Bacteroidota bacterium]
MKKIKLNMFLIVCFLLSTILSCSDDSKTEVTSTINTFLKTYKGDFHTADKNLMSTDLADLISKSVSKEELEAEKVKVSEFPTDKPLMIEGDIFSSFFEGQLLVNENGWKIDDVVYSGHKIEVASTKEGLKNFILYEE